MNRGDSDVAVEIGVPIAAQAGVAARTPSAATAIVVLVAASACSFVDRQIMSLMVVPIQADLKLSDTGVSLLLGLAFVICYALAGPPLGLLIDRRPRWRIVSVGITVWSLMTAGCAFASSYLQLFLFRMGVGVGEATLNPAAYSLLPDLVSRRRLGLSIACYGLGVYVGAGLALLIGGQVIGLLTQQPTITLPLIGTIRSWQSVFLVVGLLGVPLAVIARLMPEPRRTGNPSNSAPNAREVFSLVRANTRIFVAVTLCWAGVLMAGYSVGAWLPTMMIRTHGWSPVKVGLWFGMIIVFAGATGAVCGGLASDWACVRRQTGRVTTVVLLSLAAVPFAVAFPLMQDPMLALGLVAFFVFLQAGAAAAAPTMLQDLLPSRMRGLGSALALAVTVLLGLGVGPTLVAIVTDKAFIDKTMLRYSLSLVIPLMLLGATLAGVVALRGYSALSTEMQRK